ncbi:MAG: hypothetical protein JO335_02530 [Sphingomonas sp.]|nr:hypothetical protein [Sphingomonas sp.]
MNGNFLDLLKANRTMLGVVMAALAVGVGTGFWLSRSPGSSDGKPEQRIEWNTIAAVPTRTPDAEDNEWQERANALDAAENRTEARVSTNQPENEG